MNDAGENMSTNQMNENKPQNTEAGPVNELDVTAEMETVSEHDSSSRDAMPPSAHSSESS